MTRLTAGQIALYVAKVLSIAITLIAGVFFAVAISIFQKPENRYNGSDTAPSGEEDAIPLVVVSFEFTHDFSPQIKN